MSLGEAADVAVEARDAVAWSSELGACSVVKGETAGVSADDGAVTATEGVCAGESAAAAEGGLDKALLCTGDLKIKRRQVSLTHASADLRSSSRTRSK